MYKKHPYTKNIYVQKTSIYKKHTSNLNILDKTIKLVQSFCNN